MAESPAFIVREFSLEPVDNARLANLCGPLDENLKLVASRLAVELRRRGSAFRVIGAKAMAAESLLRELFSLARTQDITPESVHLALQDHDQPNVSRSSTREDGEGPSESLAETQEAEVAVRTQRGAIRPRGRNQREYLRRIHSHDLTFGVGPAGTGKTYLAVACAVEALQEDQVRRIVLVRPAVEAGERLGFLPGDLTQKVDPYLRPMYDALYEMMGFDRVAKLIERNVIEVAPLAFMRGRSLNDSFIILDEAQNTTVEQMKMFLTRIGFGSHAVVTGDVTQTDLPAGKLSGLKHALRVLQGVSGVAFQYFDAADVVRHPLVQRIVRAYEAGEKGASES
ncbi:MAG: PhoH family protein [Gammaproteobacteria bacterium]|jgi:phosphate starvation-inducible PhoH-like protein|nr:PhoH family protein [Gammaproteobacteria bacterium]